MKLFKTNFESIMMLSALIAAALIKTTTSAKAFKKVVIHVPMKVKHHHHTHTMVKHVHHQVPVHYDHHDVHVIHPETTHEADYEDGAADYHIPHGRTLDSIMGHSGHYSESPFDRTSEYDNYEKYLRKRSKSKQKLFNNMSIGWKGRRDFDKIASEYLASIKRQRSPPEHDDYDEQDSSYEDDSHLKRKRK